MNTKTSNSPEFVPIRLLVHPAQKRALDREADRRGETMQSLLRKEIESLTGVADPRPRRAYRRKRPRAKRP